MDSTIVKSTIGNDTLEVLLRWSLGKYDNSRDMPSLKLFRADFSDLSRYHHV